jgi:hypothetical protein
MKQEKWGLYLLLGVLMVGLVAAAAEFTQTMVAFNIQSTVAYTLTLPGQGAVTSDPTAASAATSNIYFNSTTGTDTGVSAQVAGGTVQSDGTPIFVFDNTGTVTLNFGVYLNDTVPACITLMGNSTWRVGGNKSQIIGLTNTSLGSLTPAGGTMDYYLYANFSACTGANYYRLLYTTGYE